MIQTDGLRSQWTPSQIACLVFLQVVASSIQLVRREFNAQQLTPAQHTYPPSGSSRMSEPASEPRSPSPWDELFRSPRSYYDNRTTKRNPKAPDFVHKETKEGLWLDSYRTPQWVHQQIDDLYHEERDDELAANF
ncbi:unnamed protein product [Ostreobium quekettii]|uniref:Uncharacterized protein n=1 Tax=Ostreobium quekettii TaxID=121088 RepID=A0A8S1JAC3_9CHLO|nr:unnamed protein product [Ostreobium quekettii]